MALIHE